MLTENNYLKGIALNAQSKYNIAYEKAPLFDIVCAALASKLLNHEYAEMLTEKQKTQLETIINK